MSVFEGRVIETKNRSTKKQMHVHKFFQLLGFVSFYFWNLYSRKRFSKFLFLEFILGKDLVSFYLKNLHKKKI